MNYQCWGKAKKKKKQILIIVINEYYKPEAAKICTGFGGLQPSGSISCLPTAN